MPKRVLVVDDDPVQRRILEETIKRFGYAVATADSGERALAALKADGGGRYLPGPARPRHARHRRHWRCSRPCALCPSKPPAIVQTAHGGIDTVITAMRAGAVDFVVKPVSPERLEVSIENALKIEALAGELRRMKRLRQRRRSASAT